MPALCCSDMDGLSHQRRLFPSHWAMPPSQSSLPSRSTNDGALQTPPSESRMQIRLWRGTPSRRSGPRKHGLQQGLNWHKSHAHRQRASNIGNHTPRLGRTPACPSRCPYFGFCVRPVVVTPSGREIPKARGEIAGSHLIPFPSHLCRASPRQEISSGSRRAPA